MDSELISCSSLDYCTHDLSCVVEKEVCGSWTEVDLTRDQTESMCVHKDKCGDIGKRNGYQWALQCFNGPIPAEYDDPKELLDNVATLILPG